ncbi:cytosine methylase [Ignicoccus islandicus DSM 13165]|uniref:site-specific DNA-methyltransferase (cytosine-N(4)-specific) n=1 Tax=Ignicoccus islandicus DSM 13165 TaxID=940295 RepID=A0A0U2VCK4_9CREN|nr:DNA methyltransferase [Ignicoccus islandicus]ALU11794.1 cytosine methylase [Ignicoccus islandicus DSM 13165]
MALEVSFRQLVKSVPSTTYATHGLYMHPAKFIPHVVRFALEKYSKEGDTVFDPFAGHGTVGIEAKILNRNAVLWDLNPMSRVLALASMYDGELRKSDFILKDDSGCEFVPSWSNIDYWYPEEFLNYLSKLWGFWHYNIYERYKDRNLEAKAFVLSIPLFKITRYFSWADEKIAKTYRSKYAKRKVESLLKGNWKAVLWNMYWKNVNVVIRKVSEFKRYRPHKIDVVIKTSWKNNDKLAIFDSIVNKVDRHIDLLITSPPYLQAQEYIRSFKLELAWLGYNDRDLRELSSREIPYNNPPETNIRSNTYWSVREIIEGYNNKKLLKLYDAYFKSILGFFERNQDVVDTMAIFVGPVKVRTLRVPIDEIIREHMEAHGWRHVATYIDTIKSRRLFESRINPATGILDERTPTEHLLVITK